MFFLGAAAAAGCGSEPINAAFYVKASRQVDHVSQLAVVIERLAPGSPDDGAALASERFSVPAGPSDFTLSPTQQKTFSIDFKSRPDGRLRATVAALRIGLPVLFGVMIRNFDFDAIDVPMTLDPVRPPNAAAIPDGRAPGGVVRVTAGAFPMGCAGTGCMADEQPVRMVTLSAFDIDQTEVTQAAYQECVAAAACVRPARDFNPIGTPEQPVVQVRWADALAYCTFRGKKLPTEAEWEKAARGAAATTFPWGEDPPDCQLANFVACGKVPSAVGPRALGASSYGALDLAGNVMEWVGDWYGAYPAGAPSDPTGPASGGKRVMRGGAFGDAASRIRGAARESDAPDAVYSDVGLRCAKAAL